MSGGHDHVALTPQETGPTAIHRLRPECRIAATFLMVLAIVATPRTAYWAFASYAVLLAGLAVLARVQPSFVAKRLLIEVPFVVFALVIPFVAEGEQVEVLGMSVSRSGLEYGLAVLIKGTLGVLAAVILAATTSHRDLVRGLERLHLPALLVSITGFMLRYGEVIGDDMRRMRVARESRGYQPRSLAQSRAFAAGLGALFIRSYERGERVYLGMLSRGYAGTMPDLGTPGASVAQWVAALSLPAVAALICVGALVVQ